MGKEPMRKAAIVFGGSGFIGQHLLTTIVNEKWFDEVTSVDLNLPNIRLPHVKYVTADVRDPVDVSLGSPRATIYNLPALRTFPGHHDWEYFETNILTSQRIIDFAEAIGSQSIVFTSSMAVYGPGEDEKTERSPVAPVNAYGRSKLIAEILHQGWLNRNPSARLIVSRPAVVFGSGDNGNFTKLARALERGYFVYVGRQDTIKSCGYVGDLVKSFAFAQNRNERYILYNFAYPQRYSISDVVRAFQAVAGYSSPRLTAPSFLVQAAALPFEALNGIGIKNPIHRDRVRKLFESTNIVPEWLVANKFGFGTDLERGLRSWLADSRGGRFS